MNRPFEAPVIRLEGVGKGYRVYERPLDRLREALTRRPVHRTHWALRDVSLDIRPGETFGLVGENGAGKSTLLKLVAGTLRATEGELSVHGRVAALLELGAGFHPEETGRDNVMLMGAMNGVLAADMATYYAGVAEFAELSEEVLRRPVKTYSSGMFMRLAFAAATAVDPDILVIDEALSVGDLHFQKKSLDRIMRFREAGKTVLFCSHNLYQVRSLCSRAAWIDGGRVREVGDTEHVVTAFEAYERAKDAVEPQAPSLDAAPRRDAGSLSPVRLVDVRLETGDGINPAFIDAFQTVRLVIDVESFEAQRPFHVGFAITRNDHENVFGSSTHFPRPDQPLMGLGPHRVSVRFPELPLLSGDYRLSIYVLDDTGLQVLDAAEGIRAFRIHQRRREFGLVYLPHVWESENGHGA
ncbi:MAG: ABC transporter ATP-binding protein [Halothiobacillaceae bacterium]|nr:ABC transporter ATP-binding protein [Halothiobacillaceae bacterium]MDY0050691.1 ABC transporter ATP-binding protein [Halothiobacillaceae bacterium]